jgi:hypothetical protein
MPTAGGARYFFLSAAMHQNKSGVVYAAYKVVAFYSNRNFFVFFAHS